MAGGEDVMVGKGTVRFKLGYRDVISDQGVSVSVHADVAGEEAELLRFDCFEHQPHYHYGPQKKDERLYLDWTTEGDPVEWTLFHLANRLPAMLDRAGYPSLRRARRGRLGARSRRAWRSRPDDGPRRPRHGEIHAGDRSLSGRRSGAIGLEYNQKARGVGIYALGDVNGQEVDLLTIDATRRTPTTTTAREARTSASSWT